VNDITKFEFLIWITIAIIFLTSIISVVGKHKPLERRIEYLEQTIEKMKGGEHPG